MPISFVAAPSNGADGFPRSNGAGCGGFTLIEVMLATVILTVGITMGFVAISESSAMVGSARDLAEATRVAEHILSEYLDDKKLSPDPAVGTDGRFGWKFAWERVTEGDLALMESEKTQDSIELLKMGVTVSWPDPEGRDPRQVRLVTYRSLATRYATSR